MDPRDPGTWQGQVIAWPVSRLMALGKKSMSRQGVEGPVTQDSSHYMGRPGCSCAAQQGSSQAGLNILLSARAFSSICTCLPRSDAPGNLQLFLWQVKPCGSAIHGATTGTPAFISLGLLIVHIHGLPVLPWLVEVGVGIVGCVPGYILRVPGATSMLDQGPSWRQSGAGPL